MSFPRISIVYSALWLAIGATALPCFGLQNAPPPVDNAFVRKQFGSNCPLIGMAPVVADLDGDGVEDIVIPARCTSPLMDQAENSYQVVDPYDGFFGYGNPAITTQFGAEDPLRKGYSLLIIHGTGADAWRSDAPKAKFMVVNLPYRTLVAKKFATRKKIQMALYVNEVGAGDDMLSILFWDGKKYRYKPMGGSLD
jgi:hypothetical protein